MNLKQLLVGVVGALASIYPAIAQNGALTGTVQVKVLRPVDSTAMRPNQPFAGTVVGATDPSVAQGTGVAMSLVSAPSGSGYTVKLMRMLVNGAFTSVSSVSPVLASGASVDGAALAIPANAVLTFTLGPPSPHAPAAPGGKATVQSLSNGATTAATGKYSVPFEAKANQVLKELAELKAKGLYTPSMNSEIAELEKLAKSDEEGIAFHFISYDLMHYTKTEGKPSETTKRKRCANDLIAQTAKGLWSLEKSDACTAINIELNN